MIKAFLLILFLSQVFCKHIQSAVDEEEEEDEASGSTNASKRIIMPGTLWCGNGNKAPTYDTLGEYADLDACCRDHDHCPRNVLGFSAKYGYRNFRPFTVSDCECDTKFYNCLKSAEEHPKAAKLVGKLYFNILRTPCLKFDETGNTATKVSAKRFK